MHFIQDAGEGIYKTKAFCIVCKEFMLLVDQTIKPTGGIWCAHL